MTPKIYSSDFLVIGSGIAGLTFAIKASALGSVNIVTKKRDRDSSTNYAQGGIAAVLAPQDSPASHIQDTLEAGADLCNPKAVDLLVKSGPDRIHELMDWGTRFTTRKSENGKQVLDLGREGGHSYNRIAHAKDLTGQEIERALIHKISEIDNITIYEDHTAVDLLTEHQLRFITGDNEIRSDFITCYGAYILENATSIVNIFRAGITLLATGGVGQVYPHTTNPAIATGDGIAMAYRAGAEIADMEFIQFHPTTLYQEKYNGRSFLISEAVRGEGAVLVNSRGERFMDKVHTMKELAPRDIVARAIDSEVKRLGDRFVYLDITHMDKEFVQNRFPNIYEHCLKTGIDISREPIPVVPAAHYLCGGILTDLNARSSIRNLYVSGESSCTGVHGANRLASNSLLEGVVFSHQAFLHIQQNLDRKQDTSEIPDFPQWDKKGTFDLEEWILIQHNIEDVKRLMRDYVGIVRSDRRLERAFRRIILLEEEIQDYYRRSTLSSQLLELRNMATVAKLIIRSAMERKESRGLHYTTDYPEPIDSMKKNVILKSGREPEFRSINNVSFS